MARARSSGNGGRGIAGTGGSGASGPDAVLKFRNRSISVMRGTKVNAYGSKTNVGVPLYQGIPAAIAETQDQSFDPATQRMQIIRGLSAIVPAWADIIETDTLMDETTGYFYLVESIESRPSVGYYPPDKLLSLRMRSGVSVSGD